MCNVCVMCMCEHMSGLHLENLPRRGAKIGFQKIGGGLHLATLMHSKHVICIVNVGASRG